MSKNLLIHLIYNLFYYNEPYFLFSFANDFCLCSMFILVNIQHKCVECFSQCLSVRSDFFKEYICPRCDSGFIEEVTEDSR